MAIWMDLTNSLIVNTSGMVGIVRAEFLIARNLHAIDPSVRFFIYNKYGFKEIKAHKLNWVWNSQNLFEDYNKYKTQHKKSLLDKFANKIEKLYEKLLYKYKRHKRNRSIPRNEFFIYPFKNGDVIYSCGWIHAEKERCFEKLKFCLPDIKLAFTVYDLAPVHEKLKLCYGWVGLFEDRLNWIVRCCDQIIYGGKTAQNDMEKYFSQKGITSLPDGASVKWGNDFIPNRGTSLTANDVYKKYNITEPYILAVGSFDYKKNYTVLYRAYSILAEEYPDGNYPMLVIVGNFVYRQDLYDAFTQSLLVKNKVRIITPSDEELTLLYTNCLFTALPTIYEGWSLTLPESLNYGKFCLCSDVEPLREIAGDLAIYIQNTAPRKWAETIMELYTHPDTVRSYETKIKENWKSVTWKESAQHIYSILNELSHKKVKIVQEEQPQTIQNEVVTENKSVAAVNNKIIDRNGPVLYYDLTLLHIYSLGGIPKTEFTLARYLYRLRNDIVFFFIKNDLYYEISPQYISNLLSDMPLDQAVEQDKKVLQSGIIAEKPFPFTDKDIVICVGTGFDSAPSQIISNNAGCYIQLIYDFTPVVVPHTHSAYTITYYNTFLKNTYTHASYVLYGGKTAQKDGENYQKDNGYKIVPSTAIKFGSDLISTPVTAEKKESVFEKYHIAGKYILAVGTIQPRKNYEILYDAYTELLSRNDFDAELPQLVICGHIGWKSEELIFIINNDERVRDKLMIINPTDEELDVLYQLCEFTLLPSIYEGWSLTLPESLNYHKFCLACDTPSLTEIGEDIIDYANPYDPIDWADKIAYYVKNPDKVAERVELIKTKWHNTTWEECASNINEIINTKFKEMNGK